jgi:endonuclease-3
MTEKIDQILKLLAQQYGPHPWKPRLDPLSELIYTILSQNTTDSNSRQAFEALREQFPTWDDVLQAPAAQIAETIRSGGLAKVKAPRIQAVLDRIKRERGRFDLEFLRSYPLDEAKGWLRDMPGVGPKTVACVLLFSFGLPVLPVDTHVHRVAQRLGLLDRKVDAEKAHVLLELQVEPESIYHFHMSLVEHGRRCCTARKPGCFRCILNQICPSAFII